MSTERYRKLNQLLSVWPKGVVFTQKYLSRLGYNHDLVKRYRKSKWLVSIGTGAYKLYEDNVDWYGGLFAIQSQLNLSIHVGGKTALELKGYAHYLRHKEQKVYLFGKIGEKLPKWFTDSNWDISVVYKSTKAIPYKLEKTFTEYQYRELEIRISSPERAILELLLYVPDKQGYDEAYKILESLVSLRPALLQNLLEKCSSVKVKRLFLYMSEKIRHHWFSKLEVSRIELGSGKRVIVKNGVLDKKYHITVPKEYLYEG